MCGGGGSKKPAVAPPQYQYFPESARDPQQVAAGLPQNNQASFGSELTTGSTSTTAPAATTATTGS